MVDGATSYKSIQPLILGVALLLLGIRIILKPELYNPVYRITWDTTGFNIPLGLVIAVIGVLFIRSAFIRKSRPDK